MPRERKMGLYEQLGRARTLSGLDIYRPSTDRQNHFRSRLSETSWSIVSSLYKHELSEDLLSDTVEKLRIAKNDPQHYGDNRPGSTFENGTPVVPDPRFSYWDLLGYGLSVEGGLNVFRQITGIDQSIDYATLCGIVGLLLIDASVESLESGDTSVAASDAMEAASCVEEMMLDRGFRSMLKEHRQEFSRQGGFAAHRETDEFKASVIAEYRTGRFKTKADCVRWARKQLPIKAEETVRRWLRAADKDKATTQQAK
jgi:hypothetical protein